MSMVIESQVNTRNSMLDSSIGVVGTFASSSSSVIAKDTTTLPLSVLSKKHSDAFVKLRRLEQMHQALCTRQKHLHATFECSLTVAKVFDA